ncbi:MAG: GAF domain-containing protein [Anaerolineaceae bacterium]|nr:GAF domain-containing protein [Anaerolineaceae bacterium]
MLKEEKLAQDSKQTQMAQAGAPQSAQEYLDMQRVLHEINIELFRIDDLDRLYRTAVELAHTRLGFERIGMYLLNDSRDLLLGTYGTDAKGNIRIEQGPEYVIDQRETIDTFVLGRNRLVVEEESDLWEDGVVVGQGWHIGAAMWIEDSPIGVIFADNLITGRPLKPYQPELLFAYASIVSNLIERNRFETIITKRAAELQTVADVGTAAATILNSAELLQEVVNLTKNRFDLYHAHIYLLDTESEMLVLTSGAGTVGQQMVAEGRQIPLKQEQSLVARAARSRQGVVINDVQSEPGFLPHPLLPDTRAEMAVPLVIGEQVLGVLDVQSDRINYFTKEDISTFTTLGSQTAVALQNARLFTQSEARAEELTFVNRIVTQVNALDTAAGLQFLAEELGEVLQIPSLVIGLIDDTGTMLEITAAHHPAELPTPIGSVFPLARDPIMTQALQTRQTVVVEDVANSDLIPQARDAILKTGTRSIYVIPMLIGRDLIGTVSLNVTEGGSLLTPDQLKLAETIVYQAATAVQNARLFTQVQTAFRNAEQSEAALSEALKIAKLAYWEFDVEKDLFIFNDQFYALFHTTAEAHGGYQLSAAYYAQHFVHPDDVPMVGAEIARGFSSTDRFYTRSLEHRILYADGGVGYISVNINIERDENGKILRNYGANQDITERKKAEETLRQSEAALSEALKIAKLAYWEYDVEKDLFTFNDQFYALFHTTVEDHGGYRLPSAYYAQHFVHPDDLPIVGAEIERALNSTDRFYTRSLEHRILYADGGVGYITVSINIERDEDGRILRYYGANQDITERKQVEDALRQREAELSEALKIAKLGYWEYDAEKDVFTFNDQFYALFHTTAEVHGGYHLSSAYYAQHFVHPDDLPLVGAEIEMALHSTERHFSRSLEHRILKADGSLGYISVNINVERDEAGNILRWYGANQDITERKQAEEALRQNEAELSQALRIAKLAYWEYDVEKDLFTFNDQFYALFHTTVEDHGGYRLPSAYYAQHFVHPDDLPIVGAEIERAISSTERHYSRSLEHRILYADGGVGYLSVSINIQRDEEGNILRYYGANQDVTDRREAQATIARRATELETVANVSAVAATILEPEELLQQVVELTKERFDLYHAHIYLLDKDLGQLTLSNGAGDVGQKMVAEGRQIALDRKKSLVARAARDKQGVVINDVQAEPGFLPHPLLPDTRAEMAVPLIARDEVLGVLDVQAGTVNRFMEEDINIFTVLAAQVAIALQNARSLNQSEKAVKELQELSRRLTHEGWQQYFTTQRKDRLAFSYDRQQKALVPEAGPEPTVFPEDARLVTQSLQIQGASVGQLRLEIPDEYGEDEEELLTAVTERLSAHLENLRLAETSEKDRAAAEKRSQEMSVINNIVTQISTSLDLQHSLQIVVDELVTAVHVDQVRVALIQPDGKELLVIAEHYDSSRATSAVGMTIPIEGNELTQKVIETRQLVVVEDAQNNPQTAPVHDLFREQGIQTVVLLPLVVNDEVIGTLGMDILDDRPITKEGLKLAETIVFQTATAIQNARLFEQVQATLAETEMLYSYSSQLNTATNLDAVLDSAAAAGFQVGAASAVLLVYDRDTTGNPEYAQIAAAAPRNDKRIGERLYLQDQPTRYLWPVSGQNTVFVGDVDTDDRLSPEAKETFAQQGIKALALMYLNVGNLRLGQIIIRWDKPQTFTRTDERLYGAIAQQASSVVYNRLLFNQTEEALSETAALYQASADLNTALTYDEVLNALRRHTVLGQNSIDVTINFFDQPWEENQPPTEVLVLTSANPISPDIPTRYKVSDSPIAETLVKSDKLVVYEDVATDERLSERGRTILTQQLNAKSFVYVPLKVGTQPVGFISGVYTQKVRFTEAQLRRLEVLARQATVSLQSIRLFDQTQAALAETEALYVGSESIVLSSSEHDVLQGLIQSTMLQTLDRANIFMFDEPVEDGVPTDVTIVAQWENEGVPKIVPVGARFLVEQVPFLNTIKQDEALIVHDVRLDPRVDPQTREILEGYGMRSFVLYPLTAGSQWLGVVAGQSAGPLFTDDVQVRRASSLVGQAAVVIQTTVLFRQEQARARREQLLREIAAKVRSSTDVDSIMRTAVTEIGRTLGRRAFIQLSNAQLSAAPEENGVAL